MSPVFAFIAVAALGIDVGWQPLDEGGVEYIIQIEPDQVDRIVKFDDLISNVPKDLDVRRYRITIGNEKLPRITPKTSPAARSALKKAAPIVDMPAPTKEVIAEGTIPAAEPKPEATILESSDSTPIELAEPTNFEGPELPATETTAQKPVAGTFLTSDPAPQDEEGEEDSYSSGSQPAGRTLSSQRDDLLGSSSKSRLRSESAENMSPRLSAEDNRYAPNDYEAQKPRADKSPLHTALNLKKGSDNDSNLETSAGDNAWGPLVGIFFFLLISMAANMWLGWVAWEARTRYQVLLEKYRAAGGKTTLDMV
jgi:hypothetical protein